MNPATRIVRSCELVDSVWSQVQELCNSLCALTATALDTGDFESLRSAGSWVGAWDESPSGWGSTAYAISFPVAKKGRRKAVVDAWINFQVSVYGSGIPPVLGNDKESIGPVIHVSFWHMQTSFGESGTFIEFPGAMGDDLKVKDRRLLFWDAHRDGVSPQWTFTIRLLDVDNEDALRKTIIGPIQELLNGADPAIALPESLPGLVFYSLLEHSELGLTLMAERLQ